MVSRTRSKISLIPKVVGILLIIFFIISALSLWRNSHINLDENIHHDVIELKYVLERIQKDCYIYKFEHEKSYIDFLNVIKFAGNNLGSIQLGFPENWQGAYLKNNPKIQDKFYMVLKNKQGYFVVPGDGVHLANGKVIGKDLILDQNSDMRKLMQDYEGLLSNSGVLATEIKIGSEFAKNMTQYKREMLTSMD